MPCCVHARKTLFEGAPESLNFQMAPVAAITRRSRAAAAAAAAAARSLAAHKLDARTSGKYVPTIPGVYDLQHPQHTIVLRSS